MDSVSISLLTCGPGREVYSYYGHTAVRFNDMGRGQDVVVNYGMFSFRQKYFIPRFVLGLCDYQMDIQSFPDFLTQYESEGRWVKEQTVNLTCEEKWAIAQAIDANYRPEARTYRYNFFYDNCTTRARDLITDHINGQVSYAINPDIQTSYRQMVHQWCADYPWTRLGIDLLLGVQADQKTNREQQQFLPDTLREDFDNALIINPDGSRRKLVSSTDMLLTAQPQAEDKGFPLSPTTCGIIFLVLTLAICALEWKTGRIFYGYDALVLTLDGLLGIILLIMVFSQHPTVRVNFQILILCPLSILMVIPVVCRLRRHRMCWYVKVFPTLVLAGLILGIFQKYDTMVTLVAWSLMIRYYYLTLLLKGKLIRKTKTE